MHLGPVIALCSPQKWFFAQSYYVLAHSGVNSFIHSQDVFFHECCWHEIVPTRVQLGLIAGITLAEARFTLLYRVQTTMLNGEVLQRSKGVLSHLSRQYRPRSRVVIFYEVLRSLAFRSLRFITLYSWFYYTLGLSTRITLESRLVSVRWTVMFDASRLPLTHVTRQVRWLYDFSLPRSYP